MLVTVILGVSLALQAATAALAVRVYFKHSRRGAWLLLAGAITLMAVRRSIPFTRLMTGTLDPAPDLAGEAVALVISILMFAGVAWIGPIFRRMAETERSRDLLLRRQYETQHDRSLGVLAGGVAHDFNNILTAIVGHAEIAREDLGEESIATASLDGIRMACKRASDLCSELLAYAGYSSGENEVVEPDVVVQEIVEFLRASVGREVAVTIHMGSPPPPIEVSRSRLTRVIMNLVLNAAEAVERGAGQVRVSVRGERLHGVMASRPGAGATLGEGDYAVISVSDNGRGMDEATQRRVFEPFFTTKFTGRGLGLSAAMGIVRSYGGRIEVDSTPGQGTTFTVYWPAAGRGAAPEETSASAATEPVSFKGLPVLLVDDDPSLRVVSSKLLLRMGCEVVEAVSGEDAVEVISGRRRDFRMVLLDYSMPGMGGLETLRRIREIDAYLPVVVMSGFPEERLEELLEQNPDVDFLSKPFGTDALSRAFSNAITRVAVHDGRR